MSTIRRSVFLNSVEPAELSLRTVNGLDTRLDLSFVDPNGAPYGRDVAAQMQLTGRTTGQTIVYAVPTTDVVNGKARCLIPGRDLTDMNGYRLRLVGTVDEQPALIALGEVRLVEAAGFQAVPADIIDDIDLTLSYGENAVVIVKLWRDAGKAAPMDTSVTTVSAAVFASRGGPMLAQFIAEVQGHEVTLTLPAATVAMLPRACWWRLVASTSAGSQTLAEGDVTILGDTGGDWVSGEAFFNDGTFAGALPDFVKLAFISATDLFSLGGNGNLGIGRGGPVVLEFRATVQHSSGFSVIFGIGINGGEPFEVGRVRIEPTTPVVVAARYAVSLPSGVTVACYLSSDVPSPDLTWTAGQVLGIEPRPEGATRTAGGHP